MDLHTRKDTARRLALARRARLTDEERAAAASALAERLFTLEEAARARTILAFASTGREISTDPLIERALADGRTVLLPYVTGPGAMSAARVAALDDVAPGYRGIREPLAREPVDPSQADLVLVPGVAFDAAGRRAGYGGGFYDRFLAAIPRRVPRIGICFDVQVADEVPAGGTDERVDVVLTEKRAIRAR